MQHYNLFVYGTLMRGFRANSLIPSDAICQKARIVGNLYHYVAGYPIVQIPRDKDTIEGTHNYSQDLTRQLDLARIEPVCLPFYKDYGCVYGELYKIPFDEEILKDLDFYEGFGDNSTSLYHRTLVKVQLQGEYTYAWVYNMDKIPPHTVRIYSGDWHDCFRPYGAGIRLELQDINTYWLKEEDEEC